MVETLVTAIIFSFIMTILHKLMLSWMLHELAHPSTRKNDL